MSGTLLSIVQNAMQRNGFRKPTSVASNNSDEAQTLLSLANEAGELISDAFPWQYLQTEGTFTLATGDQDYAIPTDFLFFTSTTMWNRAAERPVTISLTPNEWQYYEGWLSVAGLNLRARVNGDQFVIQQDVTSTENAQDIYYEYRSSYWLTAADTTTGKTEFTLDDDISKHDKGLMISCLKYLILKQRGLDYQAEQLAYMKKLRTFTGNVNGARKVSLGGRNRNSIGVAVPEGNYTL